MMDKRRIVTATITLAVAFAAGHFMQSGGATAEKSPVVSSANGNADSGLSGDETTLASTIIPLLPSDIAVPILANPANERFSTRVAALDMSVVSSVRTDVQAPPPLVLVCDIKMSASTIPGAMIDIEIQAPCHGNAVVTLQHASLEFSGITDSTGHYQVTMPAMEINAEILAEFSNGQSATANTVVDALSGYSRSALLWSGQDNLHIHALEFGADYGERGHVWAEDARDTEFGILAKGGFLTRLGEASSVGAKFAEIYTFPADRAKRAGTIRVIVEAEITAGTCGRNITGRTIELGPDGYTRELGLELSIPECDNNGGFLVLKNLLQDLKIAQN